ncbi:predicted protein [Uncinocarpus reesii 1704]|uniref:Uncharacterized protein n=1 Tax=Uncinocarpus reesii (strain UAMH 1704) TaxID=336963 RepID=C4JI25_UNCRE|nr:uncharacterized protein UREG_01450 [Uncinocarpus reesii 1704]EEP76601.1 predicted protein [Uncinocarpus reesii 1704]
MSEPAYLCLTPMYRALHPIEAAIYIREASILSMAYNPCHRSTRSWPPTRQNSIHEVMHDLVDSELSDQDSFPSWKSTISIDSPVLNDNEEEHGTTLLQYILNRFPESDPNLILTCLNRRDTDAGPPSHSMDEWLNSQADFQLVDLQSDNDDDWCRCSIVFFDDHQQSRAASPVGSLLNNYDSADESVASSVISSRLAWNGSPSILTRNVGGNFLELSPLHHPLCP